MTWMAGSMRLSLAGGLHGHSQISQLDPEAPLGLAAHLCQAAEFAVRAAPLSLASCEEVPLPGVTFPGNPRPRGSTAANMPVTGLEDQGRPSPPGHAADVPLARGYPNKTDRLYRPNHPSQPSGSALWH
jgi:hypothetical protein